VPTDVAAAYSAQFKPPATLDPDFGLYLVDCDAKVPAFNVVIGGKTFTVDARDQIIPAGTDDNGNIICITGTQDGGPDVDGDIFILYVALCSVQLVLWEGERKLTVLLQGRRFPAQCGVDV
jgi:hypothetical protein